MPKAKFNNSIRFQMSKFILDNQERFLVDKPSTRALAQELSQTFGVSVTDKDAYRLRECTGLHWSAHTKPTTNELWEKVKGMEAALERVSQKVFANQTNGYREFIGDRTEVTAG